MDDRNITIISETGNKKSLRARAIFMGILNGFSEDWLSKRLKQRYTKIDVGDFLYRLGASNVTYKC